MLGKPGVVLRHYRGLHAIFSFPTFNENYFNPGNFLVYIETHKGSIVRQFFIKAEFKISGK